MAQIDIIIGSMLGNAEYVADNIEAQLTAAGHQVTSYTDADLSQLPTDGSHFWLLVSSTHGAGDLPDNLVPFGEQLSAANAYWPQLNYAVVALGDSSYDTFCAAGRWLDQQLQEKGAKALVDRLEIDVIEWDVPEDALEPWLPTLRDQLDL